MLHRPVDRERGRVRVEPAQEGRDLVGAAEAGGDEDAKAEGGLDRVVDRVLRWGGADDLGSQLGLPGLHERPGEKGTLGVEAVPGLGHGGGVEVIALGPAQDRVQGLQLGAVVEALAEVAEK